MMLLKIFYHPMMGDLRYIIENHCIKALVGQGIQQENGHRRQHTIKSSKIEDSRGKALGQICHIAPRGIVRVEVLQSSLVEFS